MSCAPRALSGCRVSAATEDGMDSPPSRPHSAKVETVKGPKPGDDSAGTPEANADGGERRVEVGKHREDSSGRAAVPVPAANQCTRKAAAAGATRSTEATGIAAPDAGRGRPVRAVARQVRPIRYPLVHVTHHIE